MERQRHPYFEVFKITFWCILLACVYGILHDQVTARICLPYFTEFHPKLGLPDDPTIVAFCWGIIATWWVGAMLGVVLGMVCASGTGPRLGIRELNRPLGLLFSAMAMAALGAGLLGFVSGVYVGKLIYPPIADLTPEMQSRFSADLFAHNASYIVGFLGGAALICWAYLKRRQLREE